MLKLADPLDSPSDRTLEGFKIGSMEIYQFDCLLLKRRIPQVTNECACGLLKISSNGINGWEECILPSYGRKFDLIPWASVFIKLKGLSVLEAMAFIQNKQEAWGQDRCSLAHSALQDLINQLQQTDIAPPQKENGIVLERSYLIDQSRSYFSF
ncbi:hypothetical protein [Paenibacillus radicis (ex Xue et al. 2023)]|uniref:Uncharacterized protein n=1 Tax=Paenibacillus radicis (ex Xue et al. 2023) TaxID=2972489 RepID=A0ABT1YH94_9BACL|nr:hypothetical protein [Paenibacillus radicis (ex Xue et al. 2023)]MCR8632552.1 hypothetical protein [Paenibacillus radicis (ex Xue et al. 2023)]